MIRDPAFSELYSQYAAHVVRMARLFGAPYEQLEDLAQDVWLFVHHRLSSLDRTRSLRPWLTAVVRNHVLHARRGYARRARRAEAFEHFEGLTRGDGNEGARRREAAWTLDHALAELPDDQRIILLLCEGEGFSAPEVSEALGINTNTVNSRLRLARRKCEAIAGTLGVTLAVLARRACAALDLSPEALARTEAMLHARMAQPLMTSAPPLRPGLSGAAKVTLLACSAAALALAVRLWSVEEGWETEPVRPPTRGPLGALEQAPSRVLPPRRAPAPEALEHTAAERPPLASPDRMPWKRRIRRGEPVAHRLLSSLATEHRLIEDAERALAQRQPSLALQILAEHRQDFPNGGSAELRDMLRIRAHCARGNVQQARRVAAERAADKQFAALAQKPCR